MPIMPVFKAALLMLLLLSPQFAPHAAAQFAAENKKILLKVNLGGGPVSDFLGEEQVLDVSGFPKNIARVKIQNTDQPEIFQSTRFARGRDMTLRIPVPTGVYSLTLLFAETFRPACVVGGRVFDISLGTPVSGVSKIIESFDLFQAAGCFSAHGKRFDKVPSKEGIVVHLTKKTQHPALCGFIVEGFPMPKGDGSEYKTVGRDGELAQPASLSSAAAGGAVAAPAAAAGQDMTMGVAAAAQATQAAQAAPAFGAQMAVQAQPAQQMPMRRMVRRLASFAEEKEEHNRLPDYDLVF